MNGMAMRLCLRNGSRTMIESTTQLWPNENTGRLGVERSGSWCIPAPQMCRPVFRPSVSSTARSTDSPSGTKRSASLRITRPTESRLQLARLKKRWKQEKSFSATAPVATMRPVTV